MHKKICFFIIVISFLCLTAGVALADGSPSTAGKEATIIATYLTAFTALIFMLVFILLFTRDKSKFPSDKKDYWLPLMLSIIVAVAIRVAVAISFEGYASDIGCFKGWAVAAFEHGPSNFYTSGMFADYPPGYMYILYSLGWIRNVFNIESTGAIFTLIIKIPSIAAEVITAIIVYRIAKKQIGKWFAFFCSALVLFNPAMLFNSSAWGQIDAVFVLFIVLTLLYLKKENYLLGAFFFAIALLIKPQAVMFAPVVGLVYIYALFEKGHLKKAIVGILGGSVIIAGTLFLASIPFRGTQEPFWIIEKYADSVSTYNYASLNAFNLYALVGANFAPLTEPFLMLDYRTWGFIFVVLICVIVIILSWRSRAQKPLFDLSAFLIISVYMLAHSMHERYIIPVGICLIFAYVYSRDNQTLFFACAFTITALLGQMFTLYSTSVVAPELPTLIISAANMALYLTYAFLIIRKYTSSKFLIKTPALHG